MSDRERWDYDTRPVRFGFRKKGGCVLRGVRSCEGGEGCSIGKEDLLDGIGNSSSGY